AVVLAIAPLLVAVGAAPVDRDDVGVPTRRAGLADVADLAGLLGRSLHAVQALGEDAGHRGLAHPARPAEQVGLRDPVEPDRVAQRAHDVVLPDHIGEALRAVSP